MQKPTARNRGGFTLVELLVVILIMTVLLTIGAAGFRNAGGKGVSTALPSTEAIFDEARAIAVGKGTRSRVLIDIDDVQDEANYLRRMAIVFEATDEDGNPQEGEWELSGRGYVFPPKTFFSREFSRKNHRAKSGQLESMTLGRDVASLYRGEWLYYEFNAEGICTTGLSGGNYSAPSFVIGNGARGRGQTEPRTTNDGRRDFGGFIIWRNGATSIFRSPDQIIGSESPTTF